MGNWKRANWFRPDHIERIPSTPGVYLFFDQWGRPLYVGSSKNLRKRISQWLTYFYGSRSDGGWFKRHGLSSTVKYRGSRRYGDWLMIEARVIRKIRPANNRTHNPNADQ